jgi:hypothetical protein
MEPHVMALGSDFQGLAAIVVHGLASSSTSEKRHENDIESKLENHADC